MGRDILWISAVDQLFVLYHRQTRARTEFHVAGGDIPFLGRRGASPLEGPKGFSVIHLSP